MFGAENMRHAATVVFHLPVNLHSRRGRFYFVSERIVFEWALSLCYDMRMVRGPGQWQCGTRSVSVCVSLCWFENTIITDIMQCVFGCGQSFREEQRERIWFNAIIRK